MDFRGKTVVITGASSGLGYKLAELAAKEGCRLALLSRRKEITDKLAEKLTETGSQILSLSCDVTNKQEFKKHSTPLKATLEI